MAKPIRIERTEIKARLETRLAAVLEALAKATDRTLGELLEETVLHTFEPVQGEEGQACASPHTKKTLALIEQLKAKYGLNYSTHANYRFEENQAASQQAS